ncbi:hypothetical protein F8M41_014562 [Gigaspora margarita]|uniref:DUF7431 domain-containing protein n=1 Tax=Gigaspora margarita TaxID=4874 RepID=A0A8H4B5K3_GIGMA|nr:hypothetical protein F8M41_014562 [Gigaspora margarita]
MQFISIKIIIIIIALNNIETIIGGTDYFYGKNSWIQSLNDATKWKITGYEDVYSLFELLDYGLKQKVLSIISINECNILASIVSVRNNVFSLHVDYMDGNKNRPVIVIHHIQGENPRFKNEIKIKLGWIIFGPPTNIGFSIQYPLHVCTYVLETAYLTPQIETSPQVENSLRVKNNP